MTHFYRLFVFISINILSFNTFHHSNFYSHNNYIKSTTLLKDTFLEKVVTKFGPKGFLQREETKIIKTEDELLLEYLQETPWRANKVRNLKICYRPWKDSYKERYNYENDDTIYLYSIPEYKSVFEKTRVDEAWVFPWLWTKLKVERLSYIQKLFLNDVESVSVQENMENDAFFAEFDMPIRWGILRMREFDVLNMISFLVCTYTDFNGVKPTDLGLRPDGTVRVCPVQFHTCLSSSNDPRDTEHYAAPFKWSRSKSPDQAYEEIKDVYFKYPKRGLKWTNGWIDRGGWHPQQFSGPYFYAQAESLTWHYTDDIELVLDNEKREVQYRSQVRIGQADWDVQRLRYNQFVRMLNKKGGWEIEPMEKLHYFGTTPYRWNEVILDKAYTTTTQVVDRVITTAMTLGDASTNSPATSQGQSQSNPLATITQWEKTLESVTQTFIQELIQFIQPVLDQLQPYLIEYDSLKSHLMSEPAVKELIHSLQSIQSVVTDAVTSSSVSESVSRVNELAYTIQQSVLDFLSTASSTQTSDTSGTGTTTSSGGTSSSSSSGQAGVVAAVKERVTDFFKSFLPSFQELTSNVFDAPPSSTSSSSSSTTYANDASEFFEGRDGMSAQERLDFENNMMTNSQSQPSKQSEGKNDNDGNGGMNSKSGRINIGSVNDQKPAGQQERTSVIFFDQNDFSKLKQKLQNTRDKEVDRSSSSSSSSSNMQWQQEKNDMDKDGVKSTSIQQTVDPQSLLLPVVEDSSVAGGSSSNSFVPSASFTAPVPLTTTAPVSLTTTAPVQLTTTTPVAPTSTVSTSSLSAKQTQLKLLQAKLAKTYKIPIKHTVVESIVEGADSSEWDESGQGRSAFDPSAKSLLTRVSGMSQDKGGLPSTRQSSLC